MNRPDPMPGEYWEEYFRLNREYESMKDVLSDTEKFVRNWIKNIRGLPNTIMRAMPVIGLFLFPGFLISFKELDRRRLILVLISSSFLCLVTIAYTWDRYLLPIVPVFSILIAYCLYGIIPPTFTMKKVVRRITGDIPFRSIVIGLLILLSLVKSFNTVKYVLQEDISEYKVAGEWLKANIEGDDWLMVPEPQVAWYAGTDNFVKYPADKSLPLEEAVKTREQTPFFFIQEGLSTMLETDIDYFVYERRWWAGRYPSLIDDNRPIMPKNFVRVFSTEGPKTEVIIYKVEVQT